MPPRPDPVALAEAWPRAVAAGLDPEPAALFHDLDAMRARLARTAAAFPRSALHTVAVKANPLVPILRAAVETGAGLEAASWEEVALALAAGCPPERIVYDSPAKTPAELAAAVARGIRVNADNLAELERLAAVGAAGGVGLRVNPQVGEGRIAHTSVSGKRGRFGVPLDRADEIAAAVARFPFVDSLHLHVGSQGCALDTLVEGVARVEALRRSLGAGRLPVLDIGGGLPAVFRDTDPEIPPEAWAAALRERVPTAFADDTRLVTELGRWTQAACGWAISRVEYVRPDGVVVLHVGADLLLRRAYRPEDWHYDLLVLDAQGRLRDEAPAGLFTVVGPLCFAGDVLARDLPLPRVAPGDLVLVRDTGAYTLSMWSRHCSRAIPVVIGLDRGLPRVLRPRETVEDVVRFWGG